MEEWREIEDYPNYRVSDLGRIMNVKFDKILKGAITQTGYVTVSLRNDVGLKNVKVHRVVAKAFLEDWDPKLQVNHKDLNKTNNSVKNLEMCNASENNKHAYELLGKRKSKIRRIDKFDRDGNYITTYKSIAEAARTFSDRLFVAAQSNISKVCNGKSKTAYDYIWKYNRE